MLEVRHEPRLVAILVQGELQVLLDFLECILGVFIGHVDRSRDLDLVEVIDPGHYEAAGTGIDVEARDTVGVELEVAVLGIAVPGCVSQGGREHSNYN